MRASPCSGPAMFDGNRLLDRENAEGQQGRGEAERCGNRRIRVGIHQHCLPFRFVRVNPTPFGYGRGMRTGEEPEPARATGAMGPVVSAEGGMAPEFQRRGRSVTSEGPRSATPAGNVDRRARCRMRGPRSPSSPRRCPPRARPRRPAAAGRRMPVDRTHGGAFEVNSLYTAPD